MGIKLKIMNKIIYLILVFVSINYMYAQKVITVSGYKFKTEPKKYFLKEEKIWVTQKAYYNLKNIFQCACDIKGIRGDSIFIKGKITLKGNKLYCKEFFFFDLKNVQDSTYKIFKLQKGNFVLEKSSRYKNGFKID